MVDIYAKDADEGGRNFMLERTLANLLVCPKITSSYLHRQMDIESDLIREREREFSFFFCFS